MLFELQAELGRQRPQMGPTSNFVGNHMTQAAIDLAQAELTTRLPTPDAGGRAAPRLLAEGTVSAEWDRLPSAPMVATPLAGAALDALRKQVRAHNRRAGDKDGDAMRNSVAEAGCA